MSSKSNWCESSIVLLSFFLLVILAHWSKKQFGEYLRNESEMCTDHDFFSNHLARPLPVIASVDAISNDLKNLSGYTPEPSLLHPASLAAVQHEIYKRIKDLHLNVREQKSFIKGVVVSTLIANVGSPEGKKIILAAPYGQVMPEQDMSGVVVLLEILRDIHQMKNSVSIRIPIEFVFYPSEDIDLLNLRKDSVRREVASNLQDDKNSVSVVLILDSVGKYFSQAGTQTYPHRWIKEFYPNVGNYLALIAGPKDRDTSCKLKQMFRKGTHFPLYSFNLSPVVSGFSYPLQNRLWNSDVPAVVLTDTRSLRTEQSRTEKSRLPSLAEDEPNQLVEVVHGLLAFILDASKEIVF